MASTPASQRSEALLLAAEDGRQTSHGPRLRRPSAMSAPRMRLPEHPDMTSLWLARDVWVPSVLPPDVRLFFVGALASISGLIYGLDTGSIGPLTEMPQFKSVGGAITTSSSLQGFFVASILLSASISSLCSGYIADRISRRFGIGTGALVIIVGTTLSAASQNLASLFAARIITGIGAGQTVSVASIWLLEVATPEVRGKLAVSIQFMITIGIMTGYFICYGTQRLPSSLSWRLPFIVQAFCAVLLATSVFVFIPFSPRWLVAKGHEDRAVDVLRQLRRRKDAVHHEADEAVVQKELNEIKASIAATTLASGRSASYAELFHRRYRFRTLLGIFFMACQQLSGIDVILYFAPIVFSSIFSGTTATFLASGVSGIVLVVCTIPAQIWMDKWGRKPPMVWGGVAMSVLFLIVGSLFAAYGDRLPADADGEPRIVLRGGAAKWVVVIAIYLFIAAFSLTWAPVTRIYAGEIMPTRLRSRAAAAQQLANWSSNFCVALIAPVFLRASPSGPYFLFSGCIALSTVMCIFKVKETKGKSLEAIAELFEPRRV